MPSLGAVIDMTRTKKWVFIDATTLDKPVLPPNLPKCKGLSVLFFYNPAHLEMIKDALFHLPDYQELAATSNIGFMVRHDLCSMTMIGGVTGLTRPCHVTGVGV